MWLAWRSLFKLVWPFPFGHGIGYYTEYFFELFLSGIFVISYFYISCCYTMTTNVIFCNFVPQENENFSYFKQERSYQKLHENHEKSF